MNKKNNEDTIIFISLACTLFSYKAFSEENLTKVRMRYIQLSHII